MHSADHRPSGNREIVMTTYLEPSTGKLTNIITTLARFPASKVGSSLLSIIQSSMDGVIIIDAMRQIVLVNQTAEHIFGHPAQTLLDQPVDILMPAHYVDEQCQRMNRLASARITGRRTKVELKGLHAAGNLLSLNANVARINVCGELFLALIVQDPSMHQSFAESKQRPIRPSELRKWAASTQQATEVEKRRFSKKLYDDIGQRLSVLKLDLDWLENSLAQTDDGLPARVAQMQGLLDNVITMTKTMASALRPPLLDDFGLLPAVEWMAENFQKKSGISCRVESQGFHKKLEDPIESAIFRVIQEGLSNIERHSHASHARISFAHTGSQLDVMIEDDGIGIEAGSESKPGCYGLIAMQERIFVLGGTISIQSAEPHGVVIYASIPVEPIFPNDQLTSTPANRL
ncbi:PAS domain-containing sensor histidine kinase [Herbaspirillum sp. GCM10030257]|uniref:PAS domain-containing sensor histidine kinase n=1 Tax=Herbaspirillum sp. GCM10030257 TaxID=3273393 RepID=UPI00361236D6